MPELPARMTCLVNFGLLNNIFHVYICLWMLYFGINYFWYHGVFVFHDIAHIIARTEGKYQSKYESTKDTPHLAMMDELWGVLHEKFGENWPLYIGTALYISDIICEDLWHFIKAHSKFTQSNFPLSLWDTSLLWLHMTCFASFTK